MAASHFVSNKSLQYAIFLLLFFGVVQVNAEWRLQTIKSFGRHTPEPMSPQASLIEGDDGALYGVTDSGGSNLLGTVFKVNEAGTTLTVLHDFGSSPDDGRRPRGTLLKGRDGWLYGTTYLGGISNRGTIFKINQDGSGFSTVHHFTGGSDGLEPQWDLLEGSDGFLYGTTDVGGKANLGLIFKLAKDGTSFLVIHEFANGFTEPSSPASGLIEGKDGLLYGTTTHGGNWSVGTVFRIDRDGSNFEVLHAFGSVTNDGGSPLSTLLQGADGSLYGTTAGGGSDGAGTIYKMAADGSSYSVLRSITTTNSGGAFPASRLTQGSDGVLYGTTRFGGFQNWGTIYRIQTNGLYYSVMHQFQGAPADGVMSSNQSVVEGSDGLLYGVAYAGGTLDRGLIYKLKKDATGFSAVYNFVGPSTDGVYPTARLTAGSDGFLYGTTSGGGTRGGGTVFRIGKNGSDFMRLFNFTNGGPAGPAGGLLEATDGKLYGITQGGGSSNFGTIFTLARNGSNFNVLHQFAGGSSDGARPEAPLIEGKDGLLYGTTSTGGSWGLGTIFRVNKNGSGYTTLHRFTGGADGASTEAGLIQDANGLLYGTTPEGGLQGLGTIFKLNTNGSGFAVLHTFVGGSADGAWPRANLIESGGALYGTTGHGGTINQGTVFTLLKDGSGFAVLHSFGTSGDDYARVPLAALTEGSDGALYGTTETGVNSTTGGTIFRLNKDGSGYSVLHLFTSVPPGGFAPTALVAAGDGRFYGTTYEGGEFYDGTVFSLESTLKIITVFTNQAINEDSIEGPITFTIEDGNTPANTLSVSATASNPTLLPQNGMVFDGTGLTRNLMITPAPDQFGSSVVTIKVTDSIGGIANRSFVLTVNPVNDAPSFTKGPNVSVLEDSGDQTIVGWATGILAGPANEQEQTVNFVVASDNPGLFASGPTISSSGTLTFSPNPNANGIARVTAQTQDDGGTSNGGQDTSASQTFTISILPVNDQPVAIAQSLVGPEDTTFDITLTGSDVDGDSLSFHVVTPPAHGTLSGSGANLTYRPRTNFFGVDTFTFNANDGQLDSAEATVTINILPVNDPPVAVIIATPQVFLLPDSTSAVVISRNNRDASVVLDGRQSYDVENDPLTYEWFEDGLTNALGTGSVITNSFTIDRHRVTLIVSDGQASGSNSVVLKVISAADAVRELIAFIENSTLTQQSKDQLVERLQGAAESFAAGDVQDGIHDLQSFQKKVQSRIAAENPSLARILVDAAQKIIESQLVPARIVAFKQAQGQFELAFTGDAEWTYQIETSTNLIDWTPIPGFAVSGTNFFTAPIVPGPHCFYRAVLNQ